MFSLWDYYEEEETKRLVKNDLRSLEWRVLDFLKKYALGKDNAISGKSLMLQFDLGNTAGVRKIIKSIRTSNISNTIIGSNNNGYFIPYHDEYAKSVSLMLNKTLSMIETMVAIMPSSESILHKAIGYYYKNVEKVVEGQMQIQFNGWEREIIRKYAEKYTEEKGE